LVLSARKNKFKLEKMVKCPVCDTEAKLYGVSSTGERIYICPHCGSRWTERKKFTTPQKESKEEEKEIINLTPLMRQYQQIKQQYKDCILMFRLGDFYEMFGEDAIKSSPVLGVVLTKRQDVPMCGVPFHSVNNYISKLLNHGFKVAICEQVEDPKLAKGIVKREVVRVITPGTIIEENLLDSKKNNFLTSINLFETKNTYYVGLSNVDISTGDFLVTQFEDKSLTKVVDELFRISPSEVVAKESQKEKIVNLVRQYRDIHIEFLEDWYFDIVTAEGKNKEIH
jgi:DNA mismatch repair protein MutS